MALAKISLHCTLNLTQFSTKIEKTCFLTTMSIPVLDWACLKLMNHSISNLDVNPHFSNLCINFEIYRKKYWEKIKYWLIEESFLKDPQTTGIICCGSFILNNRSLKIALNKYSSWFSRKTSFRIKKRKFADQILL